MGGSISALEGAWAKHQHALRDLETLDQAVAAYFATQPYSVEIRFHAASGWHTAYLRIRTEPPAPLSVHVGSMAHQCYSALNHVVWRLVERKIGATRAEANRRAIALPLSSSRAQFSKHFAARNVSKAARAMLESLQPYHRQDSNPIVLLKELADADKHRVLPASYGVGYLGDVLSGDAFGWDEATVTEPMMEHVLRRPRDPRAIPDAPIKDGDALVRIRFATGNEEAKLVVREQPKVELIFQSDSAGITQPHLRRLVNNAEHYLAQLATLFPHESWPPAELG